MSLGDDEVFIIINMTIVMATFPSSSLFILFVFLYAFIFETTPLFVRVFGTGRWFSLGSFVLGGGNLTRGSFEVNLDLETHFKPISSLLSIGRSTNPRVLFC